MLRRAPPRGRERPPGRRAPPPRERRLRTSPGCRTGSLRAGPRARSPTHSRGTSVGNPYLEQVDRRRPDAPARRRPAEDDGVDPLGDEDGREVRAEERGCALLEDHGLVLPADSSRGSISTQRPPSWRSPSAGAFWSQRAPSFRLGSKPMLVNTTDRPLARAASRRRLRRLDLVVHVRAEGAFRIGEAAAEVDDEDGRPLAEREAPAQAGALVDLLRTLVASSRRHRFLAGRASCSPKRARLTNCPAPGSATSSSSSTITWPRTSTSSGAPLTSVPSKRL